MRRETVELRGSTAIGAEGIEFFSDELAWDIQEEIPNDSADCRCSSVFCAVADGLQDHQQMVERASDPAVTRIGGRIANEHP